MPSIAFRRSLIKINRRQYRNPVYLAKELYEGLDKGKYSSASALACHLGVSRARVTQVLNLLKLSPPVIAAIEELGDPLPNGHLCERKLRPLLGLPEEDQIARLSSILWLTG
jgi:hypothetical protein